MDSNTYIRACAVFMFEQSKNAKKATRVISEFYSDQVS